MRKCNMQSLNLFSLFIPCRKEEGKDEKERNALEGEWEKKKGGGGRFGMDWGS